MASGAFWKKLKKVVLFFHNSSLQCAVFSGDAVEVDTSIEAAAIDAEACGLAAIYGLRIDVFTQHVVDIHHGFAADRIDGVDRE